MSKLPLLLFSSRYAYFISIKRPQSSETKLASKLTQTRTLLPYYIKIRHFHCHDQRFFIYKLFQLINDN
ncbi:hypothetical protein H5410_032819 [Solanum commersonii]|uniref:Uncharacterized protein n=1 Tax=Solanum commersonii TaxID=4109 RepID=A0A9J5YM33_SOLCO|nr:hypothetical protein H5410_032819 [Solanum commersonii]